MIFVVFELTNTIKAFWIHVLQLFFAHDLWGICEDQFQVECSLDDSGPLIKIHLQCHIHLAHPVNLKDLNEHLHVQHYHSLTLVPETFLQGLGMLLPKP